MHALNMYQILVEAAISVLYISLAELFSEKRSCSPPLLEVDVVMTAGSHMLYQRAGILAGVKLNAVNAAVAHVGNGKIHGAVSAKEGECADGTIVLQSLHMDVIAGGVYDFKCLIHIILPLYIL